jgi:hypothetical protein
MEAEERHRYAVVYRELDFAQMRLNQEFEVWSELQLIDDAAMLDLQDWSQLRRARNWAAAVANSFERTLPPMISDATEIVGKSTDAGDGAVDRSPDLCRPWYPTAGAS